MGSIIFNLALVGWNWYWAKYAEDQEQPNLTAFHFIAAGFHICMTLILIVKIL